MIKTIDKKKTVKRVIKEKLPTGRPRIYTEKAVLEELQGMVQKISDDDTIIYLGELFEKKKYSRQRFSEWVTMYKDNKDIVTLSDTIKEILETRAVKGAITNNLNSTFTIFHLKNNYGWKDKTEVENTNTNIELQTTPEEQEDIKKIMRENL